LSGLEDFSRKVFEFLTSAIEKAYPLHVPLAEIEKNSIDLNKENSELYLLNGIFFI
jgi:hypothetical protein